MQPANTKRGKPSTKSLRQLSELFYPNYPKKSQLKTFHAQLGKTISSWQLVENNLYAVYRNLIESARPGALAAAFFSVPAFRAKLNLTSAALRFAMYDNKQILADWQTLINKAQKKADRRNEIAHGMVYTEFNEKRKERKVYVGPILNDTRDKVSKQDNEVEPITLKRLKEYEKDFRNLAREFRYFARRIPQPEEQQ
jgi:hypothetical protein